MTFYRHSNRADMALDFEDFLGYHNDPGSSGSYGSVFLFDDEGIVAVPQVNAGGILELGGGIGTLKSNVLCWGNGLAEDTLDIEWRVKPYNRPGAQHGMFGIYLDAQNYIGIGWQSVGNFRAYSVLGAAVRINADTGVAFDLNWHGFRVVLTDALLQYYIDGVLVHTDANPGVNFLVGYYYLAVLFLHAEMGADVDWVFARQQLATRDP